MTSLSLNWRHRFDGCATQWIRNWMVALKVLRSTARCPKWRPAISGTPHRSVLGLVLFNILIGYIDSEINAPSASLLTTPSCVVLSTCWKQGIPSSAILTGLRGRPVHRTRGNGFKLKEGRLRSDIRKKFFTIRVARHWHRLPKEAVDVPSLEALKARLNGALSNLV